MNNCVLCKKTKNNCDKVYKFDYTFGWVCKQCMDKYNIPNWHPSEDGIIYTCTGCQRFFWVDGNIQPCFANDGTCPELCHKCVKKTDLLYQCRCQGGNCDFPLACKKHKHLCCNEKWYSSDSDK